MKDEKTSGSGGSKKSWDELVFYAIEKIAAAPGKLKDPKESVTAAFDWVKSIRDDVQQRILSDVSERLKQIDWDAMAKKVGEHLADRYDVEVTARISLKPKEGHRARSERKQSADEASEENQKPHRTKSPKSEGDVDNDL